MKRFLIFLLLCVHCTGLQAIHITGKVSVIRPERIVIKDIERKVLATIEIPLSGEIAPMEVDLTPDLYIIEIGSNEDYVYIDSDLRFEGFLDSKNMEASQLSVSGLDSQDSFSRFQESFRPHLGEEAMVLCEYVLNDGMDPRMLPGFVYLRNMNSYEKYKMIYDLVPPDFEGATGKWLERQLDSLSVFREGVQAPSLKGVDRDGREYSIEDFRGSYILLDFWASWCGMCLREIRNMKNYYAKYAEQGIVFMSMSMDDNVEKWLKAEEEEQIPWISVLAEGGFDDSPYRKALGFKTIPFIILIDKEGVIVSRQLLGGKIEEKLDEVLTNERNR